MREEKLMEEEEEENKRQQKKRKLYVTHRIGCPTQPNRARVRVRIFKPCLELNGELDAMMFVGPLFEFIDCPFQGLR